MTRWLQVLRTLLLMGAVASVGYAVARQEVVRELAPYRASLEHVTPQYPSRLSGQALASPEAQAELPWMGPPDGEGEAADSAVPPDQTGTPSEATAAPTEQPEDPHLAPPEAWPDVVVRLPPEPTARPGGLRLTPSETWPGVAVESSPEAADQTVPADQSDTPSAVTATPPARPDNGYHAPSGPGRKE